MKSRRNVFANQCDEFINRCFYVYALAENALKLRSDDFHSRDVITLNRRIFNQKCMLAAPVLCDRISVTKSELKYLLNSPVIQRYLSQTRQILSTSLRNVFFFNPAKTQHWFLSVDSKQPNVLDSQYLVLQYV